MKTIYFFEVTDTFSGEANYCWVRRYTVKASSMTGALTMVNRVEGYKGLRKVMDTGDFVRWNVPNAAICVMGNEAYSTECHQHGQSLGCSYYEVIVGNVGTVYRGYDFLEARKAYQYGKEKLEPSVIFQEGEPMSGYDWAPPKIVPSIAKLKEAYSIEHPFYPQSWWREKVAQGECLYGYWDWVRFQLQGEAE